MLETGLITFSPHFHNPNQTQTSLGPESCPRSTVVDTDLLRGELKLPARAQEGE